MVSLLYMPLAHFSMPIANFYCLEFFISSDTKKGGTTMIHGLAERLQTLRKEKHLSQKEVANALDISVSILSNYESKERTPSLENLVALANFYRCSTDYLLGFEKPTNSILDVSMLRDNQVQLLQAFIDSLK